MHVLGAITALYRATYPDAQLNGTAHSFNISFSILNTMETIMTTFAQWLEAFTPQLDRFIMSGLKPIIDELQKQQVDLFDPANQRRFTTLWQRSITSSPSTQPRQVQVPIGQQPNYTGQQPNYTEYPIVSKCVGCGEPRSRFLPGGRSDTIADYDPNTSPYCYDCWLEKTGMTPTPYEIDKRTGTAQAELTPRQRYGLRRTRS